MTTPRERVGAIRTPDQPLRVFVSSTLAELASERAGSAVESDNSAAERSS
jgi:hypothetical protein